MPTRVDMRGMTGLRLTSAFKSYSVTHRRPRHNPRNCGLHAAICTRIACLLVQYECTCTTHRHAWQWLPNISDAMSRYCRYWGQKSGTGSAIYTTCYPVHACTCVVGHQACLPRGDCWYCILDYSFMLITCGGLTASEHGT